MLDHYGLAGERINVRQPHENGDSESSHGHFKNAVDQALYLRGSRDFASRDELLAFLQHVVAERNAPRRARYEEELASLQPLPEQRLDSCLRMKVGVRPGSLIHIHRNTYSVHSRLIGEEVEARLYADRVEVWYAGRSRGHVAAVWWGVTSTRSTIGTSSINWSASPARSRTIGIARTCSPTAASAWPTIGCARNTRRRWARAAYLRILQQAARESESAVDDALRQLLLRDEPLSAETVIALAQQSTQLPAPTAITVELPDLREFDGLLQHKEVYDVEAFCPSTFAAVGPQCGAAEFPGDGHPSPPHELSTETARRLNEQLKELRLPTFREHYQALADQAVRESLSHRQYLVELVSRECQTRNHSRIQRLMRNSHLLHGKTWEQFQWSRVPLQVARQFQMPAGGDLPGPPRECPGVRETGLGEDAHFVRTGGPTGPAGPYGAVRHLQLSGAGTAGGETRVEAQPPDQEAGRLPSLDHRRLGVCAAEPRGDGGPVHAAWRSATNVAVCC